MSTELGSPTTRRAMLNKVPEVTAIFWIIKVLATTVGETFADFLNVGLGLGLTVTSVVMAIALIYMLLAYSKGERDDLAAEQKRVLMRLVAEEFN